MKIFYEDNHIIVAYKPKGILSQADGSGKKDMLTLLKEYIKVKYNKPGNVYLGLVHRLDTNTSGIMVFARTSKGASRLSESVRNHELKKKYIATVEGIINNKDYIELESFILKNELERKSYIDKNGQQAILRYRLLSNYKIGNQDVSDIEIDLKTGRFHQIRCQMASIGHPLYGDRKYGSKNNIDENDFPLEAYYLSFPHPTTKEILEFKTKENV
ncbi:MAG: RluA family pseudouridine synthase [Acholeplasmatales bacterium]|nr:RluA family pseudouridine synthase [Acholeplasmatales bacterium]